MSWPLVKLKEITEMIDYGLTASAQKDCDGPLFLRITDLAENGVDWSKVPRCVCDEKKKKKNLLQSGDIVFARTGATTGKSYLIRDLGEDTVFASYLIRVRPSHKVFSPYLAHFFKSPSYWHQIGGMSTGATLPGVNATKLSELQFPLPPLDEQKRIAAILDKADAIRQKRKQAIDLADEFLRSVFLDMFGDPVTNPKGFPVKVLSQLYIDPKNGTKCGPFGSALKKEEFVDEGIPVWSMDNISLSGNFKDEPKLWVTEEKFNEIDAYSVIDGDVIISRAGTVGKMGVVRTKYSSSLISTNLIRVRFSEDLLPEYFVSLMTYCKGRVGRLKTGPDGSFTHMNTGILDKLEFPYPPVELQRKFLKLLADTEKYLDKMSPRQLSELFKSLSQKVFSGQL